MGNITFLQKGQPKKHGKLPTIGALFEFYKTVFKSIENSHNNTVSIFCELTRTFDCAKHNKLLNKLHKNGVRGITLK